LNSGTAVPDAATPSLALMAAARRSCRNVHFCGQRVTQVWQDGIPNEPAPEYRFALVHLHQAHQFVRLQIRPPGHRAALEHFVHW